VQLCDRLLGEVGQSIEGALQPLVFTVSPDRLPVVLLPDGRVGIDRHASCARSSFGFFTRRS